METFCYAPWNNIEILPSGKILPCCKFQDQYYDQKFNIDQHTISDFRNSAMLEEIKKDFLAGQWPKGCERCKIEEDAGIPSRRQMDFQRWRHHYDAYDIDSGELLTVGIALGNVCNLKCIVCHPSASSLWTKEYQDLYQITVPKLDHFRKNFVSSITDLAPNLVHLDIHGGEPFLAAIKEHQALLDHYIQTGRAKDVTIHYTTNATIWPDDTWFDRWRNFATIDIQLSIDGIGDRFEYLRYPAKWSVLTENVDRYLQKQRHNPWLTLSVSHTVSAFNIYYIDEFSTWCDHIGLPAPWMGKVHNPRHLRPSVWPQPIKQHIIDRIGCSQYDSVLKWTKILTDNDDSEYFEEFLKYMHRHDIYRALSYQQTFPEMSSLL